MLQPLLARPLRIVWIVLAALLAGCEGQVSIDLAGAAPADSDIAQVEIPLRGLEFSKTDGTTETLEFRDTELVDVMDLVDGDPLRLFTDEELPEGDYTGARLVIDEDEEGVVTLTDGTQFPIVFADGNYAPTVFAIEERDSSSDSFTLTLDLQQSLSFDDESDEYTLEPLLRSVSSDDAAEITGSVLVQCPTGTSLEDGGAVYLFQGEDATATDRIGDTGPYATTRVDVVGIGGSATYSLRFLPAGRYTVALTCEGDLDDPVTDDEVDFDAAQNVEVEAEERVTVDLD